MQYSFLDMKYSVSDTIRNARFRLDDDVLRRHGYFEADETLNDPNYAVYYKPAEIQVLLQDEIGHKVICQVTDRVKELYNRTKASQKLANEFKNDCLAGKFAFEDLADGAIAISANF